MAESTNEMQHREGSYESSCDPWMVSPHLWTAEFTSGMQHLRVIPCMYRLNFLFIPFTVDHLTKSCVHPERQRVPQSL